MAGTNTHTHTFANLSIFSQSVPGAMALIGSVSFFGGVTRLTMSLTVIMVEMTNDIQFLLLIMVAVLFAKWIGDFITHPFYHALIELKCIPFLDQASFACRLLLNCFHNIQQYSKIS